MPTFTEEILKDVSIKNMDEIKKFYKKYKSDQNYEFVSWEVATNGDGWFVQYWAGFPKMLIDQKEIKFNL